MNGLWSAGALTTFEGAAFDDPPLAVFTCAGFVYPTRDGSLVAGDAQPVNMDGRLADVAMAGSQPVGFVVDGRAVRALDPGDGSSDLLFEARSQILSASYGAGIMLVVRRGPTGPIAEVVDATGAPRPLDLLTDGAARSMVVTPDGGIMVFSTTVASGTVFTLPIGSQGPAAAHSLPRNGPVTNLDTDGTWVSGKVGEESFLLDLTSGATFTGPAAVRFSFDRDTRSYVGAGMDRIIDGRFFGYVRSVTANAVVFDEAEYLTGADAAAAAEAAGEESPPPNDFFIRNTDTATKRIPISDDPDVRIQGDVPQAGIGLEPVDLRQWVSLLAGDTDAIDFAWYGQGTLPYWITIADGTIDSVEEVYLP
jgi:hypothetical protein